MKRLLVTCVLLATAALACAGPAEPEARPGDGSRRLLPEDRLELPEYDLQTFEAMLEELRGTPVVVNVWGSWCPPCRAEAPDLAKLAREFRGDVQFVGVDILDTRADARDFILEYDWPYPSIYDPAGAIRDGLGYTGQPITVVYDASGEMSWEWAGVVTEDLLRRQIRKVV